MEGGVAKRNALMQVCHFRTKIMIQSCLSMSVHPEIQMVSPLKSQTDKLKVVQFEKEHGDWV